jgi:sulfhydrogenase subunit beta (sulfur reductase)
MFVVAVQCGQAGGTCFCVSMNTGPVAERGFDLALTEVIDDDRHYFTIEIGSDRGAAMLREVPHQPAAGHERVAAGAVHARTATQMGRELDTAGIKELLDRKLRAPALGRGRRTVPDLRQLHDGLPDLLLHDGRGRHRPDR